MTRPHLVLLPGLGCDAALWQPQVAALSDLASISIGDTLKDDSLPEMAQRVLAAAPPRFALAGLSMGGYLAFEIMRRAPERVLRLALLDTSARPDTPEQIAYRRKVVAGVQANPDYTALARASLPQLIAAETSTEIGDAVVAMAVRVGPESYARQQQAIIRRPDSRPLLGSIGLPALVAVGESDILTPPELSREIAAGIPGARLVTVAHAGHLTTLEQPEAINVALREWLA